MANKTVTVKPGGTGDYPSLNAALAGEKVANPNLVSMAGILTIECYDLGAADVAADTGTGWTTSALYYINIVVPAAQRHDGKWNTSKYRIEMTGHSASVGAFTNRATYTRMTGVQIKRTTTATFQNLYGTYCAAGTLTLDKCIIWLRVDHGSSTGRAVSNTTFDYAIRNSVLFCNGAFSSATGLHAIVGNTNATIENVTVNGFTWSVDHGGTTLVCKNVLSQATFTGDYYVGSSTLTGSTNNLSSRADAPGTNPQNTKTVVFVDAANGDFHLAAGDTAAKNMGADLSGTFTDDIDGVTRTGTWDIGADEYVAAGGGGSTRNRISAVIG